jgi:hypothetical protein
MLLEKQEVQTNCIWTPIRVTALFTEFSPPSITRRPPAPSFARSEFGQTPTQLFEAGCPHPMHAPWNGKLLPRFDSEFSFFSEIPARDSVFADTVVGAFDEDEAALAMGAAAASGNRRVSFAFGGSAPPPSASASSSYGFGSRPGSLSAVGGSNSLLPDSVGGNFSGSGGIGATDPSRARRSDSSEVAAAAGNNRNARVLSGSSSSSSAYENASAGSQAPASSGGWSFSSLVSSISSVFSSSDSKPADTASSSSASTSGSAASWSSSSSSSSASSTAASESNHARQRSGGGGSGSAGFGTPVLTASRPARYARAALSNVLIAHSPDHRAGTIVCA